MDRPVCDDVAAVLMALTEHAIKIDDRAWLRRHDRSTPLNG